jgi:hypothetical protein
MQIAAHRTRFLPVPWSIVLVLGVNAILSAAALGEQRFALLVGVNNYQHAKLAPLKFAVNDVTELSDILKPAGYRVVLLTDDTGRKNGKLAPTRSNINQQLNLLLRSCKSGDTVIVALAGHGLQFGERKEAYFCPADGRPFADETATLVSISHVYTEIDKSFAGVKVLFIDACRNDPTPGRGRGLDADSAPSPPKGVAALFSCSAGQRAFEHDSLKHGVFFHFVLEGLRGQAKDAENDVTFEGLAAYVRRRVPNKVHELFPDAKPQQEPNLKADLAGAPPVLLRLTTLEKTASRPKTKAGVTSDKSGTGKAKAKPSGTRSSDDRKILAELENRTQFEFEESPLSDVVSFFSDLHGINIRLDRRSLENAGVSEETPITRMLKGVSLKTALDALLKDLELSYVVENGELVIMSRDAAKQRQK